MKNKIIMTIGLPASGKSTWAKKFILEQNTDYGGRYKRVNKDDLRAMVDCGKWSKSNEKFILLTRDFLVRSAIKQGNSIIVDDTNLDPSHERDLKAIADELGADFEIKDFRDVSLAICLERDSKRVDSVGEKVIMGMYDRYLKPKIPVIVQDSKLPAAIICDIDGTIAIKGDRDIYDSSKVYLDTVNKPVFDLLKMVPVGVKIIFCSGREDVCGEQTCDWLDQNVLSPLNRTVDRMLMRKTGDHRKDSIVKEEIYHEHIENRYNILFVLDDRDQVVQMWRQQGLTCLQVADGNF